MDNGRQKSTFVVIAVFTIFTLLLLGSVAPSSTQAEEPASATYVKAGGDGIIEPGENTQEELARAAQNPVASMISLPFQNNTKPINIQTEAFYNVEKPDNGADWQLRVQLQFLFPK